jgi:hypothetical protein
MRRRNEVTVMQLYTVVDVSTKSHPNTMAIIDSGDVVAVMGHRWSATKRKNGLYVRGTVNGTDSLLHRFIMEPPADMTVDHINGNTLDNRRGNLRICTHAENMAFGADRRRGGPKPAKPVKPQEYVITTVEEWRAWREEMREHETRIKNEQSTNNRRLTKKRH